MTQSQGVNQRAGQSTITQMGLHADGAASPQGVKPHTLSACVCVSLCLCALPYVLGVRVRTSCGTKIKFCVRVVWQWGEGGVNGLCVDS